MIASIVFATAVLTHASGGASSIGGEQAASFCPAIGAKVRVVEIERAAGTEAAEFCDQGGNQIAYGRALASRYQRPAPLALSAFLRDRGDGETASPAAICAGWQGRVLAAVAADDGELLDLCEFGDGSLIELRTLARADSASTLAKWLLGDFPAYAKTASGDALVLAAWFAEAGFAPRETLGVKRFDYGASRCERVASADGDIVNCTVEGTPVPRAAAALWRLMKSYSGESSAQTSDAVEVSAIGCVSVDGATMHCWITPPPTPA